MTDSLRFLKMNGLGNDFVIVDLRVQSAKFSADDIRAIADRKDGVGCDQFITIEKGDPPVMGIWNADGSKVEACGNAARCVVTILSDGRTGEVINLITDGGAISGWVNGDGHVSVDMGAPKFGWRQIPLAEQMDDTRFVDVKLGPIDNPTLWGPSAVNVGNPHCVFFVNDVNEHAIERFGPLVENHPLFPEGVNVSIAEARGASQLRVRVWERGVGMTKACGTAACAAAVAAHRRRLTERRVDVEMDGGILTIEWRDDDHIIMTGPATFDYEGAL